MSSIINAGLKRIVVLGTAIAAICGVLAPGGVDAAEKISLGFIGPLSGGNALQGLGARNGFLLAIQQANESGYPYEVEGIALDDASDPGTGVAAALKLLNDPNVVAAIGHWNSYFNALIYLRDPWRRPLQLVLRNILITNQRIFAVTTGEAALEAVRKANLLRYTSIIVSTVPILAIYPFAQKYFAQGVMIGAVKG